LVYQRWLPRNYDLLLLAYGVMSYGQAGLNFWFSGVLM